MRFWQEIETRLSQHLGSPQTIASRQELSGGCINQAFSIKTGRERWFVKINASSLAPMFAAEAAALKEIAETRTIRVPTPLIQGQFEDRAYLILEYIEMEPLSSPARFGEQMAKLHQHHQTHFGWHMDNTIGSTPQLNKANSDWVSFFRHQRLGYQKQLAQKKGAPHSLISAVERLEDELNQFFTDHPAFPSLLHGDLWSGNWSSDAHGEPIIFDPASYYGDHEADLAMMELFGHPGAAFFSAYADILPIDPGYQTRKVLYNVYHILNHFNLFGGGYASQAQRMCEQLLSDVR